ncbi:MAG: dihydropteroate synthase [Verrucomicrobiae bacterium]|nr:dihydropteroate synthase [Verrucomicrobiae bacterium]
MDSPDSTTPLFWQCGARHRLDLSHRGEIVGILNVTPDSFSDGGEFVNVDAALAHALAMLDEGAAIIDVGGESTRPGAAEVSETEEIERVDPVIRAIAEKKPDALISIDTSKAAVGRAAVAAGAGIINDVTGLRGDPEMFQAVAETRAGVVIMHMQGTPRTMQKAPHYGDVVAEVRAFFEAQFETAIAAGIAPEAIVFDPGIGFGKTLEHNLTLIRNLDRLTVAKRPLLLGVSRKSFIGKLVHSDDLADRAWPTVALTSFARELGVPLHRVHDVKPNLEALRMTEAILGSARQG